MEVSISFKTKSAYNKFMRNMRNGKGTVISSKNADVSMEGGNILGDIKKVGQKIVGGFKRIGRDKGVKRFVNSVRPALRELKKIGKQALHDKIAEGAMGAADSLGQNDILKKQALSVLTNTAHEKVAGLGLRRAGLTLQQARQKNPKLLTQVANQQGGSVGFSNSLGGDGVSQSIQNITGNNASKARKKVGGSFRMP